MTCQLGSATCSPQDVFLCLEVSCHLLRCGQRLQIRSALVLGRLAALGICRRSKSSARLQTLRLLATYRGSAVAVTPAGGLIPLAVGGFASAIFSGGSKQPPPLGSSEQHIHREANLMVVSGVSRWMGSAFVGSFSCTDIDSNVLKKTWCRYTLQEGLFFV